MNTIHFFNQNIYSLKNSFFLVLVLLLPSLVHSQKINDLTEVMKRLESSTMMYEIHPVKEKFECPDLSNTSIVGMYRQVKTDSGLVFEAFECKPEAKPAFAKAEKFFMDSNLDSALVYYKAAVLKDVNFYSAMVYIGQIYGIKKDWKNAQSYYKQVINENYINYMAHWFLADTYFVDGDMENAMNEICIAHILNRNNPRIVASLKKIMGKAKRKVGDWCFMPEVRIDQVNDKKYKINYGDGWLGYALPKALWMAEPGYSEEHGISSDSELSTVEERECLLGWMLGTNEKKDKIAKTPMFKTFKNALMNKQTDAFILYEVFLPQAPKFAYGLPKESILELKDYLLETRFVK